MIKIVMKKVIVFDLDGTLINSLEDLHLAVNYALKVNNYPLVTMEHTRKSIGDGVAMLMKRSAPVNTNEIDYKKALKDFEDYYHIHSQDHTKPYDGMLETLKILKSHSFLLAVSTNKIEDVATTIVNNFFPNIFETICGDNGVRNKKPSPDSIIEIKKRLNLTNEDQIYYIGDSEVDYLTAVNSSATPIIVSYGYRTKEELLAKVPSNVKVVNNCKELINILK